MVMWVPFMEYKVLLLMLYSIELCFLNTVSRNICFFFQSNCAVNFNNWPWGPQHCQMIFGSWTYDMDHVNPMPMNWGGKDYTLKIGKDSDWNYFYGENRVNYNQFFDFGRD